MARRHQGSRGESGYVTTQDLRVHFKAGQRPGSRAVDNPAARGLERRSGQRHQPRAPPTRRGPTSAGPVSVAVEAESLSAIGWREWDKSSHRSVYIGHRAVAFVAWAPVSDRFWHDAPSVVSLDGRALNRAVTEKRTLASAISSLRRRTPATARPVVGSMRRHALTATSAATTQSVGHGHRGASEAALRSPLVTAILPSWHQHRHPHCPRPGRAVGQALWPFVPPRHLDESWRFHRHRGRSARPLAQSPTRPLGSPQTRPRAHRSAGRRGSIEPERAATPARRRNLPTDGGVQKIGSRVPGAAPRASRRPSLRFRQNNEYAPVGRCDGVKLPTRRPTPSASGSVEEAEASTMVAGRAHGGTRTCAWTSSHSCGRPIPAGHAVSPNRPRLEQFGAVGKVPSGPSPRKGTSDLVAPRVRHAPGTQAAELQRPRRCA
jgi:hypothetical protein